MWGIQTDEQIKARPGRETSTRADNNQLKKDSEATRHIIARVGTHVNQRTVSADLARPRREKRVRWVLNCEGPYLARRWRIKSELKMNWTGSGYLATSPRQDPRERPKLNEQAELTGRRQYVWRGGVLKSLAGGRGVAAVMAQFSFLFSFSIFDFFWTYFLIFFFYFTSLSICTLSWPIFHSKY